MKVLAGELQETVYHAPDPASATDGEGCAPLQIKSDTTHHVNDVTYISDDIGLHRVYNPSSSKLAVSLHSKFVFSSFDILMSIEIVANAGLYLVYTPPNAADFGYNIYNEATGKSSFVCQAQTVSRQ